MDALDHIGQLQDALRASIALTEALRADPPVGLRQGVWGIVAVKRLSEWDAIWDERMAPILRAAVIKDLRRPWASAVRRFDRQRTITSPHADKPLVAKVSEPPANHARRDAVRGTG